MSLQPAETQPVRVSVLMPVYNAAAYVRKAIESILAQSMRDFEFLIFDDGSTDQSRAIVEQCASGDPRLKVFSDGHRGYTPRLNRGIELARGEFIARMDADDISLPDRFERQLAFLNEHPDCVAVGGQVMNIDAEGYEISVSNLPLEHDQIDGQHIGGGFGRMSHPTVMMRTAVVRAIGGYQPDLEPLEDYDLWLRLGEIGHLANLPNVLLKYRLHLKSVSRLRAQQQLSAWQQGIDRARVRRGLPAIVVDQPHAPTAGEMQSLWVSMAWLDGNYGTALKHWRRLFRSAPMARSSWWPAWRIMRLTAGRWARRLGLR
ncbi:MAG TPA: glycosyltransferase [Pirellulales bacterium]|nr:glycosyltransferase [Pirellulales bacterium]